MKRIRVELDVDESVLPAWDRAARGNMDKGPDVWHTQVRSVEVVEPERWTELVLRRPTAFAREEGDVVFLAAVFLAAETSPHVQQSWTVVSCTEREEYPND